MKLNLILLVAALAITAYSAKAQDDAKTVFENDRNGNLEYARTTYADGSTSTTYYDTDRNGNLEAIRHRSTKPIPAPTPTPVVPAASNRSHAAHPTAPAPERTRVAQAAVIVTEGPVVTPVATPIVQKALPKDDATDYKKNIKSGKWHEFKNGE